MFQGHVLRRCLELALLKYSKMQIIKSVGKIHYDCARSDYDTMEGKDNINLVKISRAKRAGPVAP